MGIEHGMAEAAASDPLPRDNEREPRTAFTLLIEGDDEGFQFSPIDEDRLQQLVVSLVDTPEERLAGVLQRVDADRRHHRARANRGKIAAFHGRRSRSGGSSIHARQAPQAHEHLDRTVACCIRRQRARVRSEALSHSRKAQGPRGEDVVLRR